MRSDPVLSCLPVIWAQLTSRQCESRLVSSAWATLFMKAIRGDETFLGLRVLLRRHVRRDAFQQEFSDQVGCSVGAAAG
jgi:hypothetical protein